MADIKISELEPTTDLEGLYTIGSDKNNLSKKVSLQFLKDAANYANEQGDYAKEVGDTVNGNVGVNDYPAFSASASYSAGDIVRYNGTLYQFTANHAASAWNGNDVKATSINAITSGKLTELESEILGIREVLTQTLSASEYPQINISRDYKPGDKIVVEVLTPSDLVIGHLYEMSADGKSVITQHFINATFGTMEISENYQGNIRILFAPLTSSTSVSVRITLNSRLGEIESDIEELEPKMMQQKPFMDSLRIIKRVGCIGDSYTQGHIQLKGQAAELRKEYSWPFFLSQKTGNTFSNWGVGGSTTKDWINSLISIVNEPNNKCQAYIIGLGINDGSDWSQTATQPGNAADIGTDNDVYIAYYYKIVQQCLSVNPLAKVFCLTMPNRGNDYNAAVRIVVNHCNNNGQKNVILVDLAKDEYAKSEYFFNNPRFLADYSEGHYTAIGYEFMAECLYVILSDVISNNISEFQNIHQIPYDEIVA